MQNSYICPITQKRQANDMETFWSKSWKAVDPRQIDEYITHMSMEPDEIISFLKDHHVHTVCDAGCGCGIYTAKLLHHGFTAAGFDISEAAVEIAKAHAASADLKTADILSTGYPSSHFDAVVSIDVLDHMSLGDAGHALTELYRIVKPGGYICFTLDAIDEEYLTEPHIQNDQGDLIFTGGKWTGMVFHAYSRQEITLLLPVEAAYQINESADHFAVVLSKP